MIVALNWVSISQSVDFNSCHTQREVLRRVYSPAGASEFENSNPFSNDRET